MDRNEILNKVTEILRDVLDDSEIIITENTTANDVEDWDSLSHITIISEVEDEFNIKFSMAQVIGMKNVGEMIDIILEKNK